MTYLHWNKKFRTSIKNDVDCTLLCCYCARLDVITVINSLNWKLIFLLCFHWYNKFLVTSVDQDLQSLYKYFDRRWNIAVTSSDLKTVRSIATGGGGDEGFQWLPRSPHFHGRYWFESRKLVSNEIYMIARIVFQSMLYT